MKLKEFLNEINDNRIMGIGIRNSFLFIGTKDEWKRFWKRIDEYYLLQNKTEKVVKKKVPYVHLLDREVIKTYTTEVYKIFVIRLEGTKSCKYWFKHEFDRDFYGE